MARTTYWKDIDPDFKRANNGDIAHQTNNDAITNSLNNIFQTFQGSRRMVPEFALPIHGILFEPIDEITASRIVDLIIGAINRWEPRIILEGVKVIGVPDENYYEITLNYRLGAGNTQEQNFVYEDILRAR